MPNFVYVNEMSAGRNCDVYKQGLCNVVVSGTSIPTMTMQQGSEQATTHLHCSSQELHLVLYGRVAYQKQDATGKPKFIVTTNSISTPLNHPSVTRFGGLCLIMVYLNYLNQHMQYYNTQRWRTSGVTLDVKYLSSSVYQRLCHLNLHYQFPLFYFVIFNLSGPLIHSYVYVFFFMYDLHLVCCSMALYTVSLCCFVNRL